MINARLSIKQTTSERLAKIVNHNNNSEYVDHTVTSSDLSHYPMVSLPENDNYWSEGWKSGRSNGVGTCSASNGVNGGGGGGFDEANLSSHANDDLVISSSSLSTPLSTSTSSSPSPSPSSQSSSQQFNKPHTFSCFDFDPQSEQTYRESFFGKVGGVRNFNLE